MLKYRYNPTDLFALLPRLGLRFEPQLEQLDRLLDDDAIVEAIRSDMARRRSLEVSRGRRLRFDTTAVETDIHFPADRGPIGDGVRVVPGEAATGLKEDPVPRARSWCRCSSRTPG